MAETKVFDQVNAAASAIRKPVVDVYAPDYKPQSGPTARGFKTAVAGAKAAAGGLAAVAGDITHIKPLQQYGLDVAQRANAEAAQTAMPVEGVTDVKSAVDFAKYAVGYTGGNLLTLLAGGALGRVGGAALARGVPAAAEKLLLQNAATAAGAAASSIGQEVGSIYPDAVASGVPDAAARSVIGGVAAGALDLAPAALLANKLGLFGTRAVKAAGARTAAGVAKGVAKGALIGAGIEGGTEVAQTAIEHVAAGQPLTGDQAFSDFLNSFALGTVGGGVFGGVAGGVDAARTPTAAPATPGPAPTAAPATPGPAPTAAPATPGPAAPAPAPTAFQSAKPEDLQIVQEADRLALVDQSAGTATDTEKQLFTVQDRRTAVANQLSLLDSEEKLPKNQRRAKQEIVKERKALTAEHASLVQRESNLATIIAGPEYQQKTRIAQPTIIGEQQTPAVAQPIITPDQDALMRVAEQEAANATDQIEVQGSVQPQRGSGTARRQTAGTGASYSLRRQAESLGAETPRGASSVQTRLALSKRARGQLLTTEEATAVRQFESTTPEITPVVSSARETVKQPSGRTARDNFVNTYSAAVDKVVNDLAAQVAWPAQRVDSLKSRLKAAAEQAVKQPDGESAQRVLDEGFAAALKAKLPAGDVETFGQKLAAEVAATAPSIVQTYFSKAAIAPSETVAFTHWGNVPGGVTDPSKMGTGVKGADWAAARAVGLSYTSAVVHGSKYNEPDVQSRAQHTGVLDASKVYQARSDDPLLAQARAEIATQYGPDDGIAWMQYAKKVRDLGYDAMQYANGQLRIFTPQTVRPVPSKQQLAQSVAKVLSLHAANDGASFNLVTEQDLGGTKTYTVSPFKDREVTLQGKTIPPSVLAKYIDANMDLLSDPRNILGTWYNTKDGMTYLDVSIMVPSMQSALRLAAENDQIAISDLRTFTEIPVDHPVFNSAQAYTADVVGLPPLHDTPYIEVDAQRGTEIAKAYELLQDHNSDPLVAAAYEAFATEIEAQYDAAAAVVTIEPWAQEGQPYADSREMSADVFGNNHLWVFTGGDPHPYLTPEQNVKFRAVHDIYGHAKTGFEFGSRGELNATRAHAQMFSPAAVPALVTETIGQNSWVNFSEANAGLPADQRAFATQKADLLPEALWAPLLKDGDVARSMAVQRLDNVMAFKGVRMLEALEAIVGTPARLTAKVLGSVEGGTGAARFSNARDVIELSIHAKDGTSLAAHEGFHYLEQRVLSRDEKAIISRAFKRGSAAYNMLVARARAYDAVNKTNIAAEIIGSQREAHAYGYEFWNRGELTATDTLTRVFQKIRQVLERIANMVHGHGFQSREDIFRAIKAGAYARRESNVFGAYVPDAHSRGATTVPARVNEDIPSEAWLKEQVDYAKSRPRSKFGVPFMGKITSYLRTVEVPVAKLAVLAGENGEQRNVRADDLRHLTDELAENGLHNTGRPYVEVGYDGVPWVSEGNHRIMAASALGWSSMPVEVRYFDGGNRTAALGWSPTELVASEPIADQNALFSQAATVESLGEMAMRVNAGELPRTQLNMRIAEIFDDRTIPAGLKDRLISRPGGELQAFGGSVKRFLAENVMSGQNLSRKSAGYRNVFGTLTSYVQRKNVLIADAVEKRLSTWVHGASKEDKVVTSAALLTRTENSWTVNDEGYRSLRASLTERQRGMFDQATEMINSRLDAELQAEIPTYRKFLDEESFKEWYENRYAQVERLKAEGYFPERRFGDHVVHGYVTTPDGKHVTAYFSQHEREADARHELDELHRLAGNEGLTFEYGYRYRAEYDGSVSFAQFLTTADRAGIALTQPEKERIGKALIAADSTRRNRVFRRQNIAGYSQDGMRILAEFGVTMANKIAYSELGEAINDSLAGRQVNVSFNNRGEVQVDTLADSNVWAQDGANAGFYHNQADQTTEFVLSPRAVSPVASKLKAFATAHFLGGSIAAGMVNLSSLPMNTVPWLTQHTTYTDAMGKVLGAMKTSAANFKGIVDLPTLLDNSKPMPGIDEVEGLRHALQVAAQDGTILDTEIYQIMGLSRGQEYSLTGGMQKAIQVWMTPFRLAEQMNRMATFIAAFKIAKDKKLDNNAAYQLAQDTVYSTQFRYDDANRPALARGDFGSLLFVFKSYPIFVLETMNFLARENPRAAAFMLGSLVLTAGLQGVPFAEDLEDLIDTIAQRIFHSPFQTQRWLHNTLKSASEAVVGADLSSVLMHGMANTFTELNFSSRVGLSNLIPGTRIGTADADYKSVMTEIIGPTGSMIGGVLGGADALSRGEFMEAGRKALPLGAQNVLKGMQQWDKGFATDTFGRKLVDISGWEAFWQTFGMSSAAVASAYDADRIDRRSVAFYNAARNQFQSDIVKAVGSGDSERIAEATGAIAGWNSAHPDMPVSISPTSIRRSVAQAGMTINQRALAGMPRALRAQSEAAIGLDEE